MKCCYGICKRQAKYFMGWEVNGDKKFGMVCGTHDRLLGRHNLIELAGMTAQEAVAFDTECKKTVNEVREGMTKC